MLSIGYLHLFLYQSRYKRDIPKIELILTKEVCYAAINTVLMHNY